MSVAGTIVGAVVGWLLNALHNRTKQLKEKTEQEELERKQNRIMLGEVMFYILEDMHDKYVIRGERCSTAEKQRVEEIYRHYHDVLGLNGTGTQLYNEIMQANQS